MKKENIRNFSIIAHIDHGKSTLADRMLEITETVEKRKMKEQLLDQMELERERGITIKMQPARMEWKNHILNLIDTPGHIDFSYEVSRALRAVEGSVLLVDATQGVQAQTLTTLNLAKELGLKIIPVISKIDSPLARAREIKEEMARLLNCRPEDILETSGKTGEGVEMLLDKIIEAIPAPEPACRQAGLSRRQAGSEFKEANDFRALVFDFKYSTHRGIIVYIRVLDGEVSKNTPLIFRSVQEKFNALEVGIFSPDEIPKKSLQAGEIGYIVTGIKKPGIASVGDTISLVKSVAPVLAGYQNPKPVVWASIYPENSDDFNLLRLSLGKLRLSDASFSFEEESSGALGRGFRCGFLGMLHLEIITERLRREFNLELIITHPSISYEIKYKNGERKMIYSPVFFPDHGEAEEVMEPWVSVRIIAPARYLGNLTQIFYEHEAEVDKSEDFGDGRVSVEAEMPLRELMRNFFDDIKSGSSGFASLSYEKSGYRVADVVRLDMLVADEPVKAFSRVVSRKRAQEEAEKAVEKLYKILPRQMFAANIQAKALGRILSAKKMSALKKDVTGHLYGGDITRKMKLREKQKKGKKKMKERGKVRIPQDVFLKMMKGG
ncbi:MAG: translation elongation factor 4 [Candidatus Pacebacteria bacterium]|nr:translation elongation factor 4 [Candidatus Paceibacterota bacterium]